MRFYVIAASKSRINKLCRPNNIIMMEIMNTTMIEY